MQVEQVKNVHAPEPITCGGASSLTVLVPALNEEENLRATVENLFRALSKTVEDFEIIVVNDGSTDGTGEVLDQIVRDFPDTRSIHNPTRAGLGAAYVQGIQAATKSFFVFVPADNTLPHRSLVDLFGNIGKADVIVSYPLNLEVKPWTRRTLSRFHTVLLNLLFRKNLNFYGGLNVFPITFLRQGPITTPGFGFQSEVLLKAMASGLSFFEIGIKIDKRHAGSSKAVSFRNLYQTTLSTLRTVWDIQIRKTWRDQTVRATRHAVELAIPSLKIAITGASSGIGAALARSLAKAGHELFVLSRDINKLREVTGNIPSIHAFQVDVTREEEVIRFKDSICAVSSTIDAVIHCAGSFGAIGPVSETDSDEWLNTLKVNVFGPYLLTKHLLPLLERSRCPQIITFSGGGAFNPFPNYSAYGASKAALIRFSETLAVELAPKGIMVNAVAPGFVLTPAHQATIRAGIRKSGTLQYRRTQTLMKEGGASMERVIDCVKALLSPSYRGLTGKTISVNFDPWDTEAFERFIPDIARSDLYSMRRINIVNLLPGYLQTCLSNAWNHGASKTDEPPR
jgi:3-oxoacyl-[acyl-carrier protein] reductase